MQNLPLVNIFNDGRELTLFYRIDRTLSMMKDKTFLPYYYNPASTGVFRGYFGGKYNKIICREPYQIPKERTKESAEADVIYTKRYMIDKLNLTKADLRFCFYDIETQSKDFPDPLVAPDKITCITVYDNYTDVYSTFWAKEFATERELIQEFIRYLQDTKPDVMLGWNALGFDYPYLCKRCPDFAEKISPIHKVVKRNNFPAGIAIIDYMDWVKKIYKYKKYGLEYVYCDEFKLPYKPQKYEFDLVTDDIREKNIFDVRKMVELERRLKLIPYFDELRRLSKVLWEDLTMYSILVDGFILQIAKEKGFILPTKPDEEEKLRRAEDDIVGGYVYCKPGLYENVHLFDVGGTYPSLIRLFNLDPANVRKEANAQTTTIRNVHIAQDANAIIPTICSKLIASRKEIQNQMEKVTGEEAELLKKKDDAHKSLNNSVYGITLFKSSRLYNKDIAASITFLARFLIRYTKWYLRQRRYQIIASDTDSIFVQSKEDYRIIEKIINEEVITRWLKRFGATGENILRFKYEGTYTNLLMLVKKHYKGTLVKSNGEIKEVNKGIEAVRSDSSKFMEQFQDALINRILNKETKEVIIEWIRSEIERFKTLPLTEIAFPVKLSKPVESYKTDSIHVRALRYAQKIHSEWQVRIGQDFYYCYAVSKEVEVRNMQRKVKGELQEVEVKTDCNVMAFDEFSQKDFEVDYEEMLDRNIYMKVEAIFSALEWDMTLIKEKKEVKTTKVSKKAKKETKSIDIEDKKCYTNSMNTITHTEIAKQLNEELDKKRKAFMTTEQTLKISHFFKTKADITDRTIMVAEAFGLGIDEEKTFTIYDNVELKVKQGDVIYITGDSGSGKSWMLNNIFAKMQNAISINDLNIDENEVVVEGVGKDLNDALMKLNVAGLGDAFLYLRKYSQLSDGQKYRYRIAKFIDQEDKNIWILDEFCATLDRVTAKVVAYNLQKIARKLSKTVVVATTHTDLLNEIRPSVHVLKGYESDIVINYYDYSKWQSQTLEFYNEIKVEKGRKEDYEKLKRFHYRQASLGALKQVYTCKYQDEVIGVIVICYPHLALKGRNVALENKFSKMTKENCQILNKEFDSIARVIIHPKFRGIGLAQVMLKEYFKLTDATYTETLAVMANYNPFFEKAGMTKVDVDEDTKRAELVYQLKDFGFNISLLSSVRYNEQVFNKLNDEQKEKVREIVKIILSKYKGQIAKLFSKEQSIEDIIKTNLFEAMREIQRANTVYLIKKLK